MIPTQTPRQSSTVTSSICFCLLLSIITLSSLTQTKIVYMSELFRHGARYPLNDMYDGKQTKQFHGQLTAIGLREQYLLGKYIREDYAVNGSKVGGILFNGTLKPRETEIFTLSGDRCRESAYAHVVGLFPFGTGEKIDEGTDPELLQPPFKTIFPDQITKDQQKATGDDFALEQGYQPVPIRVDDRFFPHCPNEAALYARRGLQISAQLADLQLNHALFTQRMREIFKLTIAETNIVGLAQLADTLICDRFLGRPLPEKFTDKNQVQINYIQQYLLTIINSGFIARTFSTPFVKILINNLQLASQQKLGTKRLSVYSVHDVNVLPLLVFYNLTTAECQTKRYRNQTIEGNCADSVVFASNLFFELHTKESEDIETGTKQPATTINHAANQENFYVKIRYNGNYYKICGGTSQNCPLDEFIFRSRAQLQDFNKMCGVVENEKEQDQEQQRHFINIDNDHVDKVLLNE